MLWGMFHLMCTRGTTWLDDDGYLTLVVIRFFNWNLMNALPMIFIMCVELVPFALVMISASVV